MSDSNALWFNNFKKVVYILILCMEQRTRILPCFVITKFIENSRRVTLPHVCFLISRQTVDLVCFERHLLMFSIFRGRPKQEERGRTEGEHRSTDNTAFGRYLTCIGDGCNGVRPLHTMHLVHWRKFGSTLKIRNGEDKQNNEIYNAMVQGLKVLRRNL